MFALQNRVFFQIVYSHTHLGNALPDADARPARGARAAVHIVGESAHVATRVQHHAWGNCASLKMRLWVLDDNIGRNSKI